MAEFECRLKQYRPLRGLTQEQSAEQVGVRRETIMRPEKAQYNPSLKLAADLSRAVDAPMEAIFIFPQAPPEAPETKTRAGREPRRFPSGAFLLIRRRPGGFYPLRNAVSRPGPRQTAQPGVRRDTPRPESRSPSRPGSFPPRPGWRSRPWPRPASSRRRPGTSWRPPAPPPRPCGG